MVWDPHDNCEIWTERDARDLQEIENLVAAARNVVFAVIIFAALQWGTFPWPLP